MGRTSQQVEGKDESGLFKFVIKVDEVKTAQIIQKTGNNFDSPQEIIFLVRYRADKTSKEATNDKTGWHLVSCKIDASKYNMYQASLGIKKYKDGTKEIVILVPSWCSWLETNVTKQFLDNLKDKLSHELKTMISNGVAATYYGTEVNDSINSIMQHLARLFYREKLLK